MTALSSLSYSSLREAELHLFADIRRLKEIATRLQIPAVESLHTLESLITSQRFTVAVVGEFNRGKSTFINALLGDEILPAAIEACTATLNRVTYGEKPRAFLVMQGIEPAAARTREVPLDQLTAFITKLTPESEQMSRLIEEAVITYPARFCRNNVDILDTPGLNDDDVMSDITLSTLARVNCAVLVIRASIPFAASEQRFLEKLLDEDVRTILFVVTAIDEIAPEDHGRLVAEVKRRIRRTVQSYATNTWGEASEEYLELVARFADPAVFALSGYEALEAKRQHDLAAEQRSGLPTFEQALELLLAAKDGAESVRQVARRLGHALATSLQQVEARRLALSRRLPDVDASIAQISQALDHIRQRLEQDEHNRPPLTRASSGASLLVRLKIAAAQYIEQRDIQAVQIGNAAHQFLGERPNAVAVPAPLRLALNRFEPAPVDTSSLLDLVGDLQAFCRGRYLDETNAHVDQARAHLENLSTQTLGECQKLDEMLAAGLTSLTKAWPECPLAHEDAASVCMREAAARREKLESWLEENASLAQSGIHLQLQPAIVALASLVQRYQQRTSPQVVAVGELLDDTLVTAFRHACTRAVAAGLDKAGAEFLARLAEFEDGVVKQAAAQVGQLPSQVALSWLHPATGLLANLQRLRIYLDGQTPADLRELAQHHAEILRIERDTQQLQQTLQGV